MGVSQRGGGGQIDLSIPKIAPIMKRPIEFGLTLIT